jgi:S-ribosylhomocysteine lyase LuxS involved in autoinducer biosynthesis
LWIRSFQYYIENNLDPRNQNAQKVSIINEKSCQNFKNQNLPKRRQIGEHVNEKVIKIEHDIKRF